MRPLLGLGSLFHLPVVTGPEPAAAAAALRAAGLRVLAADGGTGHVLDAPGGPDLTRPTAWLLGNEAWGLPAGVLDLADEAIAVPIYGRAESLNLAAAAAVCLYASAPRQHAPAPAAGRPGPAPDLGVRRADAGGAG